MSSIALTSIPPRACSEASNRNIVKKRITLNLLCNYL